jgi:hypothetical protein
MSGAVPIETVLAQRRAADLLLGDVTSAQVWQLPGVSRYRPEMLSHLTPELTGELAWRRIDTSATCFIFPIRQVQQGSLEYVRAMLHEWKTKTVTSKKLDAPERAKVFKLAKLLERALKTKKVDYYVVRQDFESSGALKMAEAREATL